MLSVTILLASRDRLSFLQQAVASALSQRYESLEVVVVDDGSAAETRAWLRGTAAANPNLRIVEQPHAGVAAARARGVEEARGELICILDSDDLLEPGAVARIAAEFEVRPDLDLVYVNIRQRFTSGRESVRRYPRFRSNRSMIWATLLSPRVPFKHSGTTYRRTAALEIGSYDSRLTSKVDVDLFLKFLCRGKRLLLLGGEPLVVFRVHSDSLSHKRRLGVRAWWRIIDRYGPRNAAARTGLKAMRATAEYGKEVYAAMGFSG